MDFMRYNNLHTKVRKEWGKASKCELCQGKRGKRYEWSNKNHKYNFVRSEWWELCSKCHDEYDTKTFGRHDSWNKGRKGKHKNHSVSGLLGGGWNKGQRSRENIVCICGKEFYPPKKSSKFCSKSCASKGNKRANLSLGE